MGKKKILSETKRGKLYGWFLAIVGTLLVCWVIYGIVAEFTYFNISEPLRSALLSGEVERVYPPSTLILMLLMWLLGAAVGAGVLYSGIKRIKKPAFESLQLLHRS
jgi:hypothetical protein